MITDIRQVKPFLKWAGGKRQLLPQLDRLLPEVLKNREFTYIEPFVGGGAMLFHMLRKYDNINKVVINDINPYLTTAYRTIQNHPDELVEQLSVLEQHYYGLHDEDAKKDFYLKARSIFNNNCLSDLEATKYLIFLNRTCFNGLYRVNSKGNFNVPFGRHIHPMICDAETIQADSAALNKVDLIILNDDFEKTLDHIGKGLNFFYFDPPYRPLNATSSFNSYTKEAFNDNEQIRLRDFCIALDQYSEIKWMLSNADCSAKNPEDTFFEEIYKDFNFNRVYASRAINANPSKRGKLTELLICNYPTDSYNSLCVAEDIKPYSKY